MGKSEVKIEINYSESLPRCNFMQNFGSIARKMAKLWPFEHYILFVRDVRTLQQNLVANQTKSIWPILSLFNFSE